MNKKNWEPEYILRFNFAASYLDAYHAQGLEADMLKFAHRTDDLKAWADGHIEKLLAQCEVLRAGRDLSPHALEATQKTREALREVGW